MPDLTDFLWDDDDPCCVTPTAVIVAREMATARELAAATGRKSLIESGHRGGW